MSRRGRAIIPGDIHARTPKSLIQAILQAAHNEAGHNRFPRTYSAI